MFDSEIHIKFQNCFLIEQLLEQIKPVFENDCKSIFFHIDLNADHMVFPELLALIVSIIKFLKSKGIQVNGIVRQPREINKTNYVSRMDFYKLLSIDFQENFKRNPSEGRFLGITEFSTGKAAEPILQKVIRIIENNCRVEDSVIKLLDFCLNEIFDNIDRHANSPIDGYVVVQNYRANGEIRLLIADNGIGIHKSLINPSSIYQDKSEYEALDICTEKGVTGNPREGMGNGLFITRRFIEENNGRMQIFSGRHMLNIERNRKFITQCGFWQGTIVFLNIVSTNFVSIESVTGRTDIGDSFDFFYTNDELW